MIRRQAIKLLPRKAFNYKSFRKLNASADHTAFWAWDVGIGGTASSLSGFNNINLAPGHGGDVSTWLQQQYGLAFTGSFFENASTIKGEWSSTLHLTFRNQGNFGCYLKAYFCTPRFQDNTTTHDATQEMLTEFFTSGGYSSGGQAFDLTEIPELVRNFKITGRKQMKILPGDTFSLKIKARSRGVQTLSYFLRKVRNFQTRSLILQATGFPGHDAENPALIGSFPVTLDCLALHKMKGRISEPHAPSTFSSTRVVATLTNLEGQQFQKGEQEIFAD